MSDQPAAAPRPSPGGDAAATGTLTDAPPDPAAEAARKGYESALLSALTFAALGVVREVPKQMSLQPGFSFETACAMVAVMVTEMVPKEHHETVLKDVIRNIRARMEAIEEGKARRAAAQAAAQASPAGHA